MNNKWPSHFQTSKPKYYIIVHGLTMMASTACLASFSDTICSDSPGTWLLWKLSQIIFLWKIIGNFQSLTGGACGEMTHSPLPAFLSPLYHPLWPSLRETASLSLLLFSLFSVQTGIKGKIAHFLDSRFDHRAFPWMYYFLIKHHPLYKPTCSLYRSWTAAFYER